MNWEAIGALGEIAGAVAVFASLVYPDSAEHPCDTWQCRTRDGIATTKRPSASCS